MAFGGFLGPALLAGSCIAIASGLIGWFVVLRVQVFAGDALSHVAFTGALAAAAAGLDPRLGVVVATVVVALLLAALGRRAAGVQDVTIGVVFVWVLGLGALCLYLLNAGAGGEDGTIAARTLFGSIYSLTAAQAYVTALLAGACAAGVLALGRPLLAASLDAPVAAAGGLPVAALGTVFLVLLGVDTAAATQAVGALLLLGLIAAPAGAAHRLTARPYRGMALSAGIALAAMWIGLALGWYVPGLPPGAAIVLVATGFYALTIAL